MSVKRYAIDPQGRACESSRGEFIKAEDYQSLAAENEGLRAALLEIARYEPCISDFRIHQGMRRKALRALGYPEDTDPSTIRESLSRKAAP